MKLKTPYKVKCRTCKSIIPLELTLECVGSYERRMGPETEFIAVFDGVCPECGADLLIKVETWEYPEGVLKDYNVMAEGAQALDKPEFFMDDCEI